MSTQLHEVRHPDANLIALVMWYSLNVRRELASVQVPSVTELSMLRSLTKLAAYIGADEEHWRRSGANIVVSKWGHQGCQTPITV